MTKIIGITGNIGSGKSSVAKLLVAKGAVLIDADKIAREATQNKEILAKIAQELGEDLVKDGQLDRQKTADLIFNNQQ
ncbi:MAG TPA: dephospho-CoA kinase, partial [Trueperaceae bacterium]|nr:dephospho-CoA kinase [Trueperaceae bacterium]